MAEKIPMTALSPTMEEGTISSWSAKEGDVISAGDVLCEVETDKASMDYEATQEGTLLKIIVGEGGNAVVGQTIAIMGEKGEDVSALAEEAAAEGGAASSKDTDSTDSSSSGASAEKAEKGASAPAAKGAHPVAHAGSAKADAKAEGAGASAAGKDEPGSESGGAPAAEHPAHADGSRIKASPSGGETCGGTQHQFESGNRFRPRWKNREAGY